MLGASMCLSCTMNFETTCAGGQVSVGLHKLAGLSATHGALQLRDVCALVSGSKRISTGNMTAEWYFYFLTNPGSAASLSSRFRVHDFVGSREFR